MVTEIQDVVLVADWTDSLVLIWHVSSIQFLVAMIAFPTAHLFIGIDEGSMKGRCRVDEGSMRDR